MLVQQYCEQEKNYKKADYTLNGSIFQPSILDFVENPPIWEQDIIKELEKVYIVVVFTCTKKVHCGRVALKIIPYVQKISKIESRNNNTNSSFFIPTNLIKSPEEFEELNVIRNWMKVIVFQQMVSSKTQKAICGYLYYLTTYLSYYNIYYLNNSDGLSDGLFVLNYSQWLDKIKIEKNFPNLIFEQFCKRKYFKKNSILFFTPFIEFLEYISPLENNLNQKVNYMLDNFEEKFPRYFEQNPKDSRSFLEFIAILLRDKDRWGIIQNYYITNLMFIYPKHEYEKYFETCSNEFFNCQNELNKAVQRGEKILFSDNILNLNLNIEVDDN